MIVEDETCQLFKYDREFFLVTKNTPEFFAKNFVASEVNENKVAWLNYHSILQTEEITKLCENLSVDKLVVEDIYTEKQRPKVEEYNNYIFFSVRSALPLENQSYALKQEQISFILGEHYLISFQQKKSDHFTEVRERIEHNKGKIRLKGPDFLLFRMLEAIVDNYYEVLEEITQSTQRLEKRVMRSSQSEILKLIEQDKKRLAELRKLALPMKDITSQIQKSENPFFRKENKYYFDDLRDYCIGVLEEIDINKQILDGLTNLYYAVQGQRMNEIMKLLTVVSAIFIPLTFIAGLYGMNFEYIPELQVKNGYFITLGSMLVITILLIFYFKRRGWIGKN
jgi:magnesium transporter